MSDTTTANFQVINTQVICSGKPGDGIPAIMFFAVPTVNTTENLHFTPFCLIGISQQQIL